MSPKPLDVDGPLGRFATDLLELELPELPEPRRRETLEFVCRRAAQLPAPLRVGVAVVCVGVALGQRVAGRRETARFLQRTTVPIVGELARMVRSLSVAFIWETWPSTTPTGAAS